MQEIIITRHPAAIEFIARELGGRVESFNSGDGRGVAPQTVFYLGRSEMADLVLGDGGDQWIDEDNPIPVVGGNVTADDVRGKHVYGVLPLHLAALAACVTCIEFVGAPPRGTEYTLADMDVAGARLVDYYVLAHAGSRQC